MPCRVTTTDPEVGRLIAHHRRRKGITQAELAIAADVCGAQISRFECGYEFVSLERRHKIAEALGIDPVIFADPCLMEVTHEERNHLEALRRARHSTGLRFGTSQSGHGRGATSC